MTTTHHLQINDGDKIRVDGPDGASFLIEVNQLPEEGCSLIVAEIAEGAVTRTVELTSSHTDRSSDTITDDKRERIADIMAAANLSDEQWESLPEFQQRAMLQDHRDNYENVGGAFEYRTER